MEGAWAFWPMNRSDAQRRTFGPGVFILLDVKLAPQDVRTYFVTTVTANRRRLFQVESAAQLMLEVLQSYRRQHRFELHAFVIMPDHLHLLITPASDVSLDKALQSIKGGFSFRRKSKRDGWERGFNEVQIRTIEKFEARGKYIEENPVRGRLVMASGEYPFSSARMTEMLDAIPNRFTLCRKESRG
jgi:putative transposase